ncbi:MAG: WG repeat-containing protein [Verrucomicrobia bacterium]|nr:WG repeat-containing protein [Verrucomicrobiota bacterium]
MDTWKQLHVAPQQTHHLRQGEAAYTRRFTFVGKFHFPGLAPVRDKEGAYHIDVLGQPLYAQRYEATFGFYEGNAAVQKAGNWFHIDTKGKRIYTNSFAWCGNFQEKACAVRDKNSFYFHIDDKGNPLYSQRYAYAGDFHDGVAAVQNSEGLYTHIDHTGHFLHDQYFLDLDVFHKGYARAKDKAGWLHIDMQGRPLYSHRFANIEPFYNGQARVQKSDGSILVIDEQGSLIQPIRSARTTAFEQAAGELVGYWRLFAIDAAIRLGLFDSIEKRLAHPRLTRALREMDLVHKAELTDKGKVFNSDHPLSLASAARMWSQEHLLAWKELTISLEKNTVGFEILSGGKGWFDWVGEMNERVEDYHRAISPYARFDYEKLPEAIDFSQHRRVIDVGSGQGIISGYLAQKHPHLHITLLDREEVLAQTNLTSQIHTAAHNFFEPWELAADAIILARILHDWPDEEARCILQHAKQALDPGGKIYILELLLDETTGAGSLLDLNMLVMTGGKERTAAEFDVLFAEAGLKCSERRPLNPVVTIQILEPLNA